MNIKDFKKIKITDSPGVYFFMKGNSVLYIGKATSLRDRVRSYFGKDLINTRGALIVDMVFKSDKIKFQETESVLESLILEANLIKKYQPYYNTKEKDDKSWNYVCITNEEIPKVLIERGRILKQNKEKKYKAIFGPFTNGLQLKEAMRIIRRIFPYVDMQSAKKDNSVFYKQLGLTPESIEEYKENIKNLRLFFQGKKKKIILDFKKEMMQFAKKKEFEKASEVKKKIFALEHINDIALIKNDLSESEDNKSETKRIEAYDIAHLSGKNMVGVMTVVENNKINKSEYKKFIIRTQDKANDTGALREVLSRRFRHTEWGIPDLIVVDGNIAQINAAKKVLSLYKIVIPIVGVVKDEKHKAKAILGEEKIINKNKKLILLANFEAHRFAINFWRQKSRRGLI
jgi:excinuclease ABC subunit C